MTEARRSSAAEDGNIVAGSDAVSWEAGGEDANKGQEMATL